MTIYLRNTKMKFGKYKGKKLCEVWNVNPSYITDFILEKVENAYISKKTLDELKDPSIIKPTKYCYKGYIDDFLSLDEPTWLAIMHRNYENNRGEFAGQGIVRSWEDCFKHLKYFLKNYKGKRYYVIFEYELELGSGRRPDVILLMENDVVILEFKEKDNVSRKDILQLQDYADNLLGYHVESRGKQITPILVGTRLKATLKTLKDSSVKVCSPNCLNKVIDSLNAKEISYDYDPESWIKSKYEPLRTIVESARMIMSNKAIPQIKQAESAGIPEALALLKQVVFQAESKKEHVLALVTGVPGAGKTLIGLQFTYDSYGADHSVKSVYLSGNGPLIKVLQSALESKVFIKDLHAEITNYYEKNIPFNKNIVVFDEGQRAWDEERVEGRNPKLKGLSEPDLVINMVDNLDWGFLLILVGEGQAIYKGEEQGIGLWNEAVSKCKNKWKVLCPNEIEERFYGQQLIKDVNRNRLDLKVSLRSGLAGQVSNWVDEVLKSNIPKAKILAKEIKSEKFKLLITRDLKKAKRYCNDKYEGIIEKRYGLIVSSEDHLLKDFSIDNSYKATNVNYGDWYNNPLGDEGSCCNLTSAVTEFGCQGLELDLPVLAWGDDMLWEGNSWKKYTSSRKDIKDPNQLRVNSYRVLMTRGRDGLIIFVPKDSKLDGVYSVLRDAGMEEIY